MRFILTSVCLSMLCYAPTYAAGAGAEMPQLMQLNQQSQQELWWMQHPYPRPPATQTPEQLYARELQRQQQLEQRRLQEGQRRELLLRRHATITDTPEARRRLDAINQQRQFQLQQRNQLDWFRGRQWIR